MSRRSKADERAAAVFAALGDPTRRDLLASIGRVESATATELAWGRDVSRQAIVKHLQVLAGAGLIESTKQGREQRYRLAAAPFDSAMAWMAKVGPAWDERLDRLRTRVADTRD